MSSNLFENILLVVDGSEASVAAAQYAVRVAAQTRGSIHAVCVVDTATTEYLAQMQIFIEKERHEFERELEQTAGRYLDYVKTLADQAGVTIECARRKGSFHQTIIRMAREMQPNVLVLGGWRRTIMAKDTMSVERQLILDETDCPVIVVKPQS